MTEHEQQKAFFEWFRQQYPFIVAFAIPNGGHRHPAVGRKLKDEGVLAGVPDIFVADGRPGLFIEMKLKGNKPTEKQQATIKRLKDAGYNAVVCYSLDEAITATNFYLRKNGW